MTSHGIDAEGGFTLAEVLMATTIVAIGFVAVAAAFQYAISGIDTGRGEMTAAFLAEQKLEELKGLALVDWSNAALAPGTTTEHCSPAGDRCIATSMPGLYRRTTTLADSPGGACSAPCKVARVTVLFRPVGGDGQLAHLRGVEILMLVTSRT